MLLVLQIALGVVFGVLALAYLTQIVAGTRKVFLWVLSWLGAITVLACAFVMAPTATFIVLVALMVIPPAMIQRAVALIVRAAEIGARMKARRIALRPERAYNAGHAVGRVIQRLRSPV